jgi:hypothetical protein
MLLYANRTRFSAIVTIKIESTDNPSSSVLTGAGEMLEKTAAEIGFNDFLVDGGRELHLSENTVATLFAVRSAS